MPAREAARLAIAAPCGATASSCGAPIPTSFVTHLPLPLTSSRRRQPHVRHRESGAPPHAFPHRGQISFISGSSPRRRPHDLVLISPWISRPPCSSSPQEGSQDDLHMIVGCTQPFCAAETSCAA